MNRTPRRLGLLDAMILVAAVAIGFAWSKFQAENPVRPQVGGLVSSRVYHVYRRSLAGQRFGFPAAYWAGAAAPMVASLGVGLVVAGWRRDGRPARVALRRSRAAACVAASATLALQLTRFGIHGFQDWSYAPERFWLNTRSSGVGAYLHHELLRPAEMGIAVAATWAALALGGRLRAEPSMRDRIGRLVGVFWIALMLLYWAVVTW